MSSALKAFEDLGYFAIDNLPIQLIPTFVRLCDESSEIDRTAFVVDVRSREFLGLFPHIHEELKEKGVAVTIVFLEADDDVLLRRYSETRRPHPLPDQTVVAAIRAPSVRPMGFDAHLGTEMGEHALGMVARGLRLDDDGLAGRRQARQQDRGFQLRGRNRRLVDDGDRIARTGQG